MRISSVRAGASGSSRQAPRLQRQTSVLHELQETQDKESLEMRNARLMTDLAALCSDRDNVLTTESLEYLASEGRVEPVKLEREPEKAIDALLKSSLAGKQEDLLSADAARRQRVEELTRFFMEAKSDIEFALGGGREFREAREKDKAGEIERDDDKDNGNETGDDDDDVDDASDPQRQVARLHYRLLKDKLDDRVYNTMLVEIRETDPALYGAILCHPLVTGVDPKKDKRKKKRRKDKSLNSSTWMATTASNAMLSPDLMGQQLSPEEMKVNVSRFIARSIADGSIQGLLLATKMLLSWILHADQAEASDLTLPLVTHLRVLRGEKAPEIPKRVVAESKTTSEPCSDKQTDAEEGEDASAAQTHALSEIAVAESSAVTMEMETDSDALASLRAGLGRFGDGDHHDHDDHDHDDDEDDDDDDDDDEDDDEAGEETGTGEGEGVDEDALMARAIALSLSPEINLRDQGDMDFSPNLALVSSGTATPAVTETPPRPSRFSPAEILALGPFLLPQEGVEVDAITVAVCLVTQVGKLCLEYLESCSKGLLPSGSAVQPHPLVFMLINSVTRDLMQPSPRWQRNVDQIATWKLFVSCSRYSVLRALEAHFFHIEITNMSPASVGLGHIAGQQLVSNRLVDSLKNLVEECVNIARSSQGHSDNDVLGAVVFASTWSTQDVEAVTALYETQVYEHGLIAWVRGVAHFYPTQTSRYELIVAMLRHCLQSHASSTTVGQQNASDFVQLELLCARLSLPDLVQGFVPQCGDVVVVSEGKDLDGARNAVPSPVEEIKSIDDAAILTACQKTAKSQVTMSLWKPDVIRASLQSGTVTPRCLLDFLSETTSPELLEAAGVSGLVLADSRSHFVLANAYEQLWDESQRRERDALECIAQLPHLVDALRESVLQSSWPRFSLVEDLQMPHAPLVPNIDRLKKADMASANSRLLLLRSIQDVMVVRVGGARGDEPPALEFDPTRCAETMTLTDGSKTARQFTAKQWGMVMATTGCPPNSGIHEWAVRLDRCEKGHIFLGVCTRDASVATYVGGDRQGWGLIGTRALWHNRSKVRGDYGDGFSTGTIVRVRLNTDSGALSFGVDDSDWGIAFDGLTQHGALYPAIGLYQRDDQVTILPVRTSGSDQSELGGVSRGVREVVVPAILQPFLHHIVAIVDACCKFLKSTELARSCEEALTLRTLDRVQSVLGEQPLLFSLVTPLMSALSMLSNFHGLSSVLAWHFVPWCTRLLRQLDWLLQQARGIQGQHGRNSALDVSGEWELKSMASGNIPAQQYHLTLTQEADGSVTGKSTGSFTTVTLTGAVIGTKVRFMETWRQGGTCLVEGRLRADGDYFAGSYEDAKSHTSGNIVGHKIKSSSTVKNAELRAGEPSLKKLAVLEVVCANLVGMFSRALIDCERPDLVIDQFTRAVPVAEEIVADGAETESTSKSISVGPSECTGEEYEGWVDSLILSGGLPSATIQEHLKDVVRRIAEITKIGQGAYTVPELAIATNDWLQFVLPKAVTRTARQDESVKSGLENDFVQDLINGRGEAASVDRWVSRHVGESPFLRLGGEPMKVAKRTVVAAMLWHSGFLSLVKKILRGSSGSELADSEERPHENLMHIWRAAQRVIEWAIRAKNSMGSTYAIVAALVIRKAEFLLQIEPSGKAIAASTAVTMLSQDNHAGPAQPSRTAVYECAERIYSEVLMQVSRFLEAPIRISSLQSRMLAHSTRAFLRIVGMMSFRFVVADGSASSSSSNAIQSSFALSAALQWLSPASHSTASTSAVMKEIIASTADTSDIAATTSSAPTSSKAASGHYFYGLGGCGKHLESDIREAFENLYGFLSASLSKATWAHDADLQLVMLETWGIVIQPDDHAFLSRVGIFRVLQTVLDDARSQDVSMDTTSRAGSSEESSRVVESRRNVVQATLKVVHLLAAQVAHESDLADAFAVPADTALSSFGGLAVGAIPLLRKPSGPETLSKSVFHMLYTELKNALEDIRNHKSAGDSLSAWAEAKYTQAQAEPTEADQGPNNTEEEETTDDKLRGKNDSEEYCYQICSLLYSVSGSPVCRTHLSSSRWLRLLLVLLELGSVPIQRRSLKLLRRILPELDPATIKLRPDAMDVFDVDSDDEADAEESESRDQAATLINFFMGIVSSMSPPSLVEAMLRRLPGSSDSSGAGNVISSPAELPFSATSGLAGEVVLLLRSLYESPKWSAHLSSAIAESLRSLNVVSKPLEDNKSLRAPDADVEMEDTSSRSNNLPSVDEWVAQSRSDLSALAALCVLDGHIESLRIGATVKILPKSMAASSATQEGSFRSARGVVVAYEPEKASAEVLIKTGKAGDSTGATRTSSSVSNRPIRVPVEDLMPVADVELDASVFSDEVLTTLLVTKLPFFIDEIKRSQARLKEMDGLGKLGDSSMEEPDEDDDMSNDGSVSSPSNMDSEMMAPGGSDEAGADADGDESDDGDSDSPSPHRGPVDLDGVIETSDVMKEMEKEAQLHRMLLCQHGLRATALLLRDKRAAEVFIRGGAASGNLFNLLQIAISETPTAGLVETGSLEESWVFLWTRWFALRRAAACPAPKKAAEKKQGEGSGSGQQGDEGAEAEPNAMVQQMMEMGFPKEWCEVALTRCSQNVEAAINFCFEHSSDMERLVGQYKAAKESAVAKNESSGSGTSGTKSISRAEAEALLLAPLLEQLAEMGFPLNWCKKALAANRNNVDAALTWILSNGEALEAEDRREEEAKQRAIDGVDAAPATEAKESVPEVLKPNPLRAVSGQATIGENDLMVEGLVGAGFPSVGAPDCLVSRGRWYYEATLLTNGCIQIGWADVAFNGSADRGDGVGDGAHSWAYDGWRQQKWHGQSSPWGSKWKQGDVVGCAVDVDAGTILFSRNGKMKSLNMGVAFRGVQFAHGLYPCASFNRRERLQFNLGGSPFKHPPPPGFRPILHVLCKEGETVADLPRGFAVIGRGEDCLEEAIGEENYSNDARYFGREVHPSVARTAASSGHAARSGSLLTGSSRAEMFAELKAIPDDRVYMELLLLSRSLAVLHARRALLTILAKWPTDRVGRFSMECFTPAPTASINTGSNASRFIDFIKLIASCSGGNGASGMAALSSTDSSEVDEYLDYCLSGRHALSLLASVTRSAIDASLSASLSPSHRHELLDVVLGRITVEVQSASERVYARVPWDATDALVTASFLQLSSESGQAWSDREVLKHPNVFLAEWFSRLLMDSLSRYEEQLDEKTRNFLRIELLKAWLAAFKSPGLCVKEKAFGIIGGILQDTLLKATSACHHHSVPGALPSVSSSGARELVQQVLEALSLHRLLDLADERLLKEYAQLPVCSRYLQSIVELVSAGSLASSIVGLPTDSLFATDQSKSLAASRRLDADLVDINTKEFEEEQERRRVLAEEEAAAAKAALEAAATAAAEAAEAAAAAALEASLAQANAEANGGEGATETSEPSDQQMQETEATTTPQQDEDNNNNAGGTSTNMDVDSDSEDNPDLTLSAIADMVAEDSDVASAAAAMAAAAQGRLTIKHTGRKPASEEAKPASAAAPPSTLSFDYTFPEEKMVFDLSMLDDDEQRMLEAGSEGILGDEPMAWHYGPELGLLSDTTTKMWSGQLTQYKLVESTKGESKVPELVVGCKVIRGPNWKWRDQDGGEGSIGVVEGVSPWSGVEGEGMSVRWPNDSLYTYRWGADGNYDLIHVEVNEDGSEIVTKHPTPQVRPEEEGTFGCELHLGVLLHLFDEGSSKVTGVLELPDFGAAVRVVGIKNTGDEPSVVLQELQLIRGNADMGWTLRFGSETWQPGTKYKLAPVKGSADESIWSGEYTHQARRAGKLVQVRGELRVTSSSLFTMDPYNHFSTLSISDEGMTVTCNSGESRNLALGTVGFATGIHYWEVRVDQAEFGSVFIGVCEKAGPPGSQAALANRLNRWTGWGFVNFRATYHNSTERIYGDHFNAGDTIGVRLDMEQGKLAFFMDGMKFGEHIVADLGVAFDNMKGERNSRTLYPCIGMRKTGDRVALNGKWVSVPGVSSKQLLCDALDVSASLHSWYLSAHAASPQTALPIKLSDRLLRESWREWKRWNENRWERYAVRPRGVLVDFDTYPSSCIAVSKAAGLGAPFLAGDRVRICSTYGRELTQPEEAVILGVYRGSLWYRTETQGNEGSDEGRSWAWYFSSSELAELLLVRRNGKDMTLIENSASDLDDESLATEAPFKPQSDLERQAHTDLNAFIELATVAHTPASDMQLVERLNIFCAASGVDITNLRIGDVVTPNEKTATTTLLPRARRLGEVSERPVTRPFVHDEYFSSPALKPFSGPQLRARCALLRVFNGKVTRALPLIALQPSEATKDAIDVAPKTSSTNSSVVSASDYPSTSLKLRALRRLIFTSSKRSFWDAVLRSTTTSTPLPSDEYEDPREIRTIRINRIQAQPSKLSLLAQPSDRLRRSVFGQLYREMRTWNDSSYRRAYCGKGHGGQKRAFKVKFLGEGVNDYGGPYRAVFEQVVDELQMDNVELSKGEQGLLPLLIPSPNRRSGTGGNQDKFLLNPSCGTSLVSSGPMALDLHRFLGKVIGTAVRHGLQMGLDLPSLVWRPLAGLEVSRAHLESIDIVAANNLARVEEADASNAQETLEYLTFSTTLSDGLEVPLCANGDKIPVTVDNRLLYVELVEKKRLTESHQQLAALRDGLSAVLPMELATLFTPRELEVLICGRREVDVELLRQCTEYGDSVDESMTHVQAFWEVLKEMTSEERTSFLRFVWARSRMPNSAKDFPMNFKIQSAHDSGAQVDPDKYLPHAQTCFFALRLPNYTSKEILREKLLYAIQNSPNMDADVRLHNAEGWADA